MTMFYFLHTRRIMPRRPILAFFSASLFAKAMWLHHITHSLFYITELLVTDMYNLYTPMFFHHVAASSLMVLCMLEPGILCVVYVLPFWVHGVFWVRGAVEFNLLTLYNYCLLMAGIAGTYDSARLRVITPVIPIICLALSSVNIFTCKSTTVFQLWINFCLSGASYLSSTLDCWSYQGYYCPPPILPFEREEELTIGLTVWFILLVIGCTYLGRKHRRNDPTLDVDFTTSSSSENVLHRHRNTWLSNLLSFAKSWTLTKLRQNFMPRKYTSTDVEGIYTNDSSIIRTRESIINMATMWETSTTPENGYFVNNSPRKHV